MNLTVVLVVAILAVWNCAALPINEDAPFTVIHRERRDDPPKFYGSGGGIGQSLHGNIGVEYPNGAGGELSYGHAKGYGHDVSIDARVPIWSTKSQYGETTLNAEGGVSQHFGGPSGNEMTEKRIGLGIVHRY